MKPYKCPICDGTTNVAKGFYTDDPKRTNCRACIQGVVYAPTKEAPEIVTVSMPYPVPQPYPVYPLPVRPYYPWVVPPTVAPIHPGTFYYTVTCDNPKTIAINGLSSGANEIEPTFSVMS